MTASLESPIGASYALLRSKLLRANAGNELEYGEFLSALRDNVERYLTGKSVGNYERDDIVQDVLMSVHLARHTYDPSKPFGPWLVSIIRRRLVDRFRAGRRFIAEDIYDYQNLKSEERDIDSSLSLEKALNSLKPNQRNAIIGTEIFGRSGADVAAELGMDPGPFRVMLHRALKSLRKLVEV